MANGGHLFDTTVPLVSFREGHGEATATRYTGLEIPDDGSDTRLKEPHIVAVVSYTSDRKVIREALITCDDPNEAEGRRSLEGGEHKLTAAKDAVRVSMASAGFEGENVPADEITFVIPIAADDLDLAHAKVPPHFHVTSWKR